MRLMLMPVSEAEASKFSIDNLHAKQYLCVTATRKMADDVYALRCGDGDLSDPATDPLIIGTVPVFDDDRHEAIGLPMEYQPRVLWRDRLWKPFDHHAADAVTAALKKNRNGR